VRTTPTAIEPTPDMCCPAPRGASLADADAIVLANTYAALADPVRLKLLSLIATSGEICSCDMVEPLAKSQPTVSHHTKVLAEAGLITGDKRGRWVYWSVAPTRADFVRQVLNG
jgi:ArsR family transcriptional regulator